MKVTWHDGSLIADLPRYTGIVRLWRRGFPRFEWLDRNPSTLKKAGGAE